MEKRKIVFATGNRGKLREASEILGEGFELFTPMDFGLTDDIPETGTTLEENSLQKAEFIFERKGCDCFADDTGLEVEALGGAPGVYTARYAGEGKDFGKNMDKVSHLLEDAIMSIIDAKDEGDIDSFFGSGQTTFLSGGFSGLDDFELICFMVVI